MGERRSGVLKMNHWTIGCFIIAGILMLYGFFFMGIACVVDSSADMCSGSTTQTQNNTQVVNIFEEPSAATFVMSHTRGVM